MGATFLILASMASLLNALPALRCPAPRSPEHGQSFVHQDGRTVKFVCDPGYTLQGRGAVRCGEEGEWEAPAPLCEPPQNGPAAPGLPAAPRPPRILFDWGGENDTDAPQGDEARLRVLLLQPPRRRSQLVRARGVLLRARSEEEGNGADAKREDATVTTVQLRSPPRSVLYVRQTTGKTDDQEGALREQYRRAAVHLTTDAVKLLPGQPAAQDDKGEDALYRQYWRAHQYRHQPGHPGPAVEYLAAESPAALTESQVAWINSLHPELRDRYLRDLHALRAAEAVEGARALAFLRRYDALYPYHVRQPVAAGFAAAREDASFDYSCNRAGAPFVRAPRLPGAHVARYDRRQNRHRPHNHFLAAVYRCDPGHEMLDARFTELYCSRGGWGGAARPVCVPR